MSIQGRNFLGDSRIIGGLYLIQKSDVFDFEGQPLMQTNLDAVGIDFFTSREQTRASGRLRVVLPADLSKLESGDIIRIAPAGTSSRVLWRPNSRHNFLFLTERCNQLCIMCSQPPRDVDDRQHLEDALTIVRTIHESTDRFGVTGGEPLLHGEKLLELLNVATERLSQCSILVLTNGRAFADADVVSKWNEAGRERVTAAIPIYSHHPDLHDYIVQSAGAWAEAMDGILNLCASGAPVELRCVLQKSNVEYIEDFATWIARNIPFVNQVSFMGLEITGYARVNLDEVWVEPAEYAEKLARASSLLANSGIDVKIYNLPLCLIPDRVRHLAVQSISDWKNKYIDECATCSAVGGCAGFFTTSRGKFPRGIKRIEVK